MEEGVTSQGMWAALEGENSKETSSPLGPPEGMQPDWHLDFNPPGLILDFWPPELSDSVSSYGTMFVVTC